MLDIVIGYNMALAVTRSISKTEFKKMENPARIEILRFIDDAISLTYGSKADVKIWRQPFEKKYKELSKVHEDIKQKELEKWK
jgi:hypothetical protein